MHFEFHNQHQNDFLLFNFYELYHGIRYTRLALEIPPEDFDLLEILDHHQIYNSTTVKQAMFQKIKP